MKNGKYWMCFGAVLAHSVFAVGIELELVDSYSVVTDTAEIIDYDSANDRLFTTHGSGVEYMDFNGGAGMSYAGNIDMSGVFGGASIYSVSSVALHHTGGYGVASVISNDKNEAGKVVFFDAGTGSILKSVDVGYHPDMVTFNGDQTKVLIANEGEPSIYGVSPAVDQAGSLSVIDVTGLNQGMIGTASINASTYDFTSGNLNGASLSGLRINPANAGQEYIDMEPEYITVSGSKAYVTLQENNAIAEFDLSQNKWTKIHDLGTISQTVDASDKDGDGIIDDVVKGMPMPDAIASYTVGGNTYLVTANEGDGRGDYVAPDSEEIRYADAVAAGKIDATAKANLDTLYQSKIGKDSDHDDALGRLTISLWDGDTDGDGDIDEIMMYGTRSVSIWNAATGALVNDSGSELETLSLAAGVWEEKRSDNKGPEPEGVIVEEIDGMLYAFVGLERTGNIMIYDVTDPNNMVYVDGIDNPLASRPEGLKFFEQGGESYLAVAYEKSDSVDIFHVIPEPTTVSLIVVCGGLLLFTRRKV